MLSSPCSLTNASHDFPLFKDKREIDLVQGHSEDRTHWPARLILSTLYHNSIFVIMGVGKLNQRCRNLTWDWTLLIKDYANELGRQAGFLKPASVLQR